MVELRSLATDLHGILGKRTHPPSQGDILLLSEERLQTISGDAEKIDDERDIYLVERLLTTRDWWVAGPSTTAAVPRIALFAIKGGVGRSTTAAILARHLASKGQQVLLVDLDLESPGLSAALLDTELPDFGVTDWLVEDLVEQGDDIVRRMAGLPTWARDLDGHVHVVPAHGREPGNYLAKLGRAYMYGPEPWTSRLDRMLESLQTALSPTVVVMESRSGLHDAAAAAVTHLNAHVLLFGTDSDSTWLDYDILFRHWRDHDLAEAVRHRLSVVSSLTPETQTVSYLQRFRENAWDLFRDNLYDDVSSDCQAADDAFSFDRDDDDAPHSPWPIHWTRGLAAGASLRDIESLPIDVSYSHFLERFDSHFRHLLNDQT